MYTCIGMLHHLPRSRSDKGLPRQKITVRLPVCLCTGGTKTSLLSCWAAANARVAAELLCTTANCQTRANERDATPFRWAADSPTARGRGLTPPHPTPPHPTPPHPTHRQVAADAARPAPVPAVGRRVECRPATVGFGCQAACSSSKGSKGSRAAPEPWRRLAL